MKQPVYLQRLILIALVLETVCVTYALNSPALIPIATVVHTVAGLIIAYGLLWIRPAVSSAREPVFSFASNSNRYRWLLMGIALFILCRFSMQWMKEDPINYHSADMLPIIKVMNQRFFSGSWSHVYDPIPEIWNGIKPIYLPAMWMPFGLPEAMQVDVRWLTVAVFFMVLGIFLWTINPLRKNAWPVYLCAFLLFWWLFSDENAGLFTFTEEGIVMFYYVLLACGLLKRNTWLICIAATLCVFSRYALAGWLPAMVLYFVYLKEWKNLFRLAAAGIAFFVFFLLLPFGWDAVHSLILLPGTYIEFTKRIWNDVPQVFSQSLGWAKFFGPNHILRLHYLLILLSFVAPSALMFFALRWKRKYNIPVENIPLAVLKLSLVIFFSLIDVPYIYLFYTSSFVSLIAVSGLLSRGTTEKSTA